MVIEDHKRMKMKTNEGGIIFLIYDNRYQFAVSNLLVDNHIYERR